MRYALRAGGGPRFALDLQLRGLWLHVDTGLGMLFSTRPSLTRDIPRVYSDHSYLALYNRGTLEYDKSSIAGRKVPVVKCTDW